MKYTVTYQSTQEVDAKDRGEAIAQVRDTQGQVDIISVVVDRPTGHYL